jgi:hypothetical protein
MLLPRVPSTCGLAWQQLSGPLGNTKAPKPLYRREERLLYVAYVRTTYTPTTEGVGPLGGGGGHMLPPGECASFDLALAVVLYTYAWLSTSW